MSTFPAVLTPRDHSLKTVVHLPSDNARMEQLQNVLSALLPTALLTSLFSYA